MPDMDGYRMASRSVDAAGLVDSDECDLHSRVCESRNIRQLAGLCLVCQRLRGEVVPNPAGSALFRRGSHDGGFRLWQAFRREGHHGNTVPLNAVRQADK